MVEYQKREIAVALPTGSNYIGKTYNEFIDIARTATLRNLAGSQIGTGVATFHTVPADTVFYLTGIHMSSTCEDAAAPALIHVEGGHTGYSSRIISHVHPDYYADTSPTALTSFRSFNPPLKYTAGNTFTITVLVAGARAYVEMSGWEEAA